MMGYEKNVNARLQTMNLILIDTARKTAKGIYLAILTCVVILTNCSNLPVTNENTDDNDITWAIWNALQHEQRVNYRLINVKTTDGKVELSGSVNSLFAKKRAGEIAESIKGVCSVENRLSVISSRNYKDR